MLEAIFSDPRNVILLVGYLGGAVMVTAYYFMARAERKKHERGENP